MIPRIATGPLRARRAEVRAALEALSERIGALSATPPPARRDAMRSVVADLDASLRPHLEWEERTVHPVVDKFACEGPAAFSASMRYEHVIIHRWSADLARRAERGDDAAAFTRAADRLLGVVLAHFELEEEVLFPILDRSLAAGSRVGTTR